MPADLDQLEDRLRAAYADAAATVRPEDISEQAPAAMSPARRRGAARSGRRRATALAAAAAVLLVVITATVIPHVLSSGGPNSDGDSHLAYVVAQPGLLFPVDLATGTALKPIPLHVTAAGAGVTISPDGRMVYVLTELGQLAPVDVRTGAVGKPIKIGKDSQSLVTTPNGKAAYVLEPADGVEAVDLATGAASGFIKVHGASDFTLSPNGKTLYVVGTATNTTNPVLTAISTATNATVSTLPLSGPDLQSPTHREGRLRGWSALSASVTVAPDGKTVYVPYVSIQARSKRRQGSIIPVDVAGNTELKPISAGRGSIADFTISPDSRTGYLADRRSVIPVDLRTGAMLPSIPIPAYQYGYGLLKLSPGGQKLYLIQNTGPTVVVPVDTVTGAAVPPIRLGAPRWEALDGVFAPGGKTFYVLSYYNYSKAPRTASRMTPIDVATGAVGKPIDIPADVRAIVFSP